MCVSVCVNICMLLLQHLWEGQRTNYWCLFSSTMWILRSNSGIAHWAISQAHTFFFFWLHTFYFIFWYVTDFILESAAQAVLKFICSRAFNFWSSCLHLPSAVITAVHHHTQFIWCWESSVHVLSAALHPSPQSAFSYILLSTSWFLIKMKRVRRKQSAFQKMVLEKLDSHRQKMDFDNLIIIQTIYFKNFKWRLENWLSS